MMEGEGLQRRRIAPFFLKTRINPTEHDGVNFYVQRTDFVRRDIFE